MGLLEKAMQYKRELNKKGEETLIDRISGPAEGSPDGASRNDNGEIPDRSAGDNEVVMLSRDDLEEVSDDAAETSAETDEWIEKELEDVSDDASAASGGEKKKPARADSARPREPRVMAPPSYEGSFKDYLVLFETGKEIIHAGTEQELFDTLIFLIMGQIGVSSVSIMIQDSEQENRWIVAESRGVSLDEDFSFENDGGIMGVCGDRGEIIDIEDYSRDENFKEDYLNFISIDARMLVPMIYNGTMTGIIVIGNKISNEEFTDDDKDYLYSVSQFSAVALYTLTNNDRVRKEIDTLRGEISGMEDMDRLRDEVFASDTPEEAKSALQREMVSIGVDMYAFYIINEFNNSYIPVLAEEKDYLTLMESQRRIDIKNGIVQFVSMAKGPVEIEDYASTDAVAEIFSKTEIKRMNMLKAYPFRLGDSCVGFLAVFRLSEKADRHDIDSRLARMTDILYPYLIGLDSVRYTKKKYIDTVERVLSRIEEELGRAEKIGIPLTLVEVSIKNFKRYYKQFGIKKTRELMAGIESMVKTKLSDADFSIRHDRNRILIVLPGKNRDFAAPLSNALKNEIVHAFSTKEVQLLVTFLAAEYPRDGENVYALIDSIE